jgi:hypothetical protein
VRSVGDVTPPAEEEPAAIMAEEDTEALVAEFGIVSGDLDETVYNAANEDGANEYNGCAHPELSDDAAYEEVHDAADARASSVNNQDASSSSPRREQRASEPMVTPSPASARAYAPS